MKALQNRAIEQNGRAPPDDRRHPRTARRDRSQPAQAGLSIIYLAKKKCCSFLIYLQRLGGDRAARTRKEASYGRADVDFVDNPAELEIMSTTLVEDVEARLRADIVRGVFAPSQPLRMETLKARFDTGASPIREALSRLLSDGMVELEPNRGFRVTALNRADLLDIAVARIAVETAAVRAAIELGDEGWESEIVAAMHRYRRRSVDQFATEERLTAWERAHDELHTAIVGGCASPRLLAMQARLQEQHMRYRRLIVIPEVSGDAHVAEHQSLVEYVLERNTRAAVSAIERHMMITVDALAAARYWDP